MSMPAAAQEDASVAPAATSPRTTAARDSTTGAASHTEAELARQVLECEATLVAGVECVQSVASCLAAVTAALEGREPPSEYADASLWMSGMGGAGANSLAEGSDHASSAWFLPAHAGRFAGGSALLTELLRSLRAAARANASGEVEGGSVPAEWVNLTFLRRQFEEEAANATSVRADVVERCTNAMGSACAMQ
ncbi:hypothetical protein EON68_01785 [archaeon]|nr:MAG: hypothetical protein EON68_01785 [archaeon]